MKWLEGVTVSAYPGSIIKRATKDTKKARNSCPRGLRPSFHSSYFTNSVHRNKKESLEDFSSRLLLCGKRDLNPHRIAPTRT